MYHNTPYTTETTGNNLSTRNNFDGTYVSPNMPTSETTGNDYSTGTAGYPHTGTTGNNYPVGTTSALNTPFIESVNTPVRSTGNKFDGTYVSPNTPTIETTGNNYSTGTAGYPHTGTTGNNYSTRPTAALNTPTIESMNTPIAGTTGNNYPAGTTAALNTPTIESVNTPITGTTGNNYSTATTVAAEYPYNTGTTGNNYSTRPTVAVNTPTIESVNTPLPELRKRYSTGTTLSENTPTIETTGNNYSTGTTIAVEDPYTTGTTRKRHSTGTTISVNTPTTVTGNNYSTGTAGHRYTTGTIGTTGTTENSGISYIPTHGTIGDIGSAGNSYSHRTHTGNEATRLPYVHGTKGILPTEVATAKGIPYAQTHGTIDDIGTGREARIPYVHGTKGILPTEVAAAQGIPYAQTHGTIDDVGTGHEAMRVPYVHGTKGILPTEVGIPHSNGPKGILPTAPITPTTGTNITPGIIIHIHQHDEDTEHTEHHDIIVPVPQTGESIDFPETIHLHAVDHTKTDHLHNMEHPHTDDHHYTSEKHHGEHYNELAYRQKELVSPDQEPHRAREALELLHELQVLLKEDNPSIDLAANLLKRTEDFTVAAARNPDMDADTRKTLDDITSLLLTARLMGKNKNIAERLQIISDETAAAVKEVRRSSSISESTREYTESLKDFVSNWRPLFYMMTSSSDFRQLLIDVTLIARHMIYSYTEDIREEGLDQFEQGASTREIASTVKDMVKVKGVPEMTEEEFERLEEDLQRILILLAREPNYREGIIRIFSLLDVFQRSLAHNPIETTLAPHNVHLRRAVEETEELVASFSGRESLDRFKYYLRHLVLQVQKDVTLHTYLHTIKVWLLKARSEDEIRDEEFRIQTRKLVYRGRELFIELGNKEDVRPFLEALEDMMENIKNDEFLQILRQQAGIVQSDLSYVDSTGKLQVDTSMLSKLQTALLPVLADALKYIPIPKIHVNNKDMEFWLDNIVLCSYDIMPEHIHFHLESDSDVYMRDIETKSHTYLVIELNKLLTEIKDIEFYFRKKKTPSFEDHGRVTFRLKGNGARLVLTYTVHQDPLDTIPQLREGYASFDISAMSIEFDKSTLKHPKLVPLFTNMFKSQIRHQIEKAVEKNMSGFIQKLGDMMSRNLSELNKPSFLTGLEHVKNVVKASPMAQVYEKRREKLE